MELRFPPIDMHEVVWYLINEHGIPAFIEGGVNSGLVIYAGEILEDGEHHPAIAGPGAWQGPGRHAEADPDTFTISPDDDGESVVLPVGEIGLFESHRIAEAMARVVNREVALPRISQCESTHVWMLNLHGKAHECTPASCFEGRTSGDHELPYPRREEAEKAGREFLKLSRDFYAIAGLDA